MRPVRVELPPRARAAAVQRTQEAAVAERVVIPRRPRPEALEARPPAVTTWRAAPPPARGARRQPRPRMGWAEPAGRNSRALPKQWTAGPRPLKIRSILTIAVDGDAQ